MATLTNISGSHRALPLISKKYVEFARGESKDFPDADWMAIKGRASVAGDFRVEGANPAAGNFALKQGADGQVTGIVALDGDIKSDGVVTAPKPARAKKG